MTKGSIGLVRLNVPRVESELPSVYHVVMASRLQRKISLPACQVTFHMQVGLQTGYASK